jgi:small subunit ribosomal protein S6
MRKYEIMLILPAEADDKVIGAVTDRITGVLGPSGGEITKTDRWGKRRFAYPIAKITEGFYLVSEFSADPTILKELDRVLSLADDVIRFKVVVRPDEERAAAKGRGVRPAPATQETREAQEAAPPAVPAEEPVAAESDEPAPAAEEEPATDASEATADTGAA